MGGEGSTCRLAFFSKIFGTYPTNSVAAMLTAYPFLSQINFHKLKKILTGEARLLQPITLGKVERRLPNSRMKYFKCEYFPKPMRSKML